MEEIRHFYGHTRNQFQKYEVSTAKLIEAQTKPLIEDGTFLSQAQTKHRVYSSVFVYWVFCGTWNIDSSEKSRFSFWKNGFVKGVKFLHFQIFPELSNVLCGNQLEKRSNSQRRSNFVESPQN